MSSQNILQQIFSKHPATNQKLPLPFTSESRSASDTLRDRPWQEIQQTETFAIAFSQNHAPPLFL